MTLRRTVAPITRAVKLWSEADGLRMSAAMSFYGILSLAPLLLVLVAVLGWWLDREMLETGLVSQIGAVVGEQGGKLIEEALKSAKEPVESITATIVGLVVLAFGATGVFGELQDSFQAVWSHGRETPARRSWWRTATLRLRGVAYILVFGFLLLVSLALSTLLTMFSGWASQGFAMEVLLRAINEGIGFAFGGALFYGLMRLSGGPKPRHRYLLVGAFVAAILFTIGRQVLTIYLSSAAVVSAYGAAGSLIVLLMWIYFSSAVLLFGAGCARALEDARNDAPASEPAPDAKPAGAKAGLT
ncbi:YihY/virulence factor BrkB family protein [Ramlibacter sp.]|uniref:YihY/virulence factor BrkB family protein n=1 Tax=Ramlibacter sp. TaxID=1917967 RepID=UPI003D0A72A1